MNTDLVIDYAGAEKAIGYVFKDKSLLINAFTHSSFTNEHKDCKSNERLEFLGDSILGYIIAEDLFKKYPDDDEGMLTLKKQSLVSKTPLSQATISAGYDRFLLLGEGGKRELTTSKTSLCENLFEALVAAIYLDGGITSAKKFVFSHLSAKDAATEANVGDSIADYKSELLHIVQKRHLGEITYEEVSKTGPSHAPLFKMVLKIDSKPISIGTGSSHKIAEKSAAKAAIEILQSEDFDL